MKRSVGLSLLALCLALSSGMLASCTPDAPEGATAEASVEADEGWLVHVAGPEADEDHPGSVLLTRRAEDGGTAYRPRLVLGCEEGVTQAYVEWGTPLGAAEIPITFRLDGGAPRAVRWQVSVDGEAVGRWHDSTSVPFIRSLLGYDRLSVDVTPEGEGAITGAFVLGGLDSLVAPVQELCGWE